MPRKTLEQYHSIFNDRGIDTDLYSGANGQFLPLLPELLGRPLKHDEMDYNLELLDEVLKNYRVLNSSGSSGALGTSDLGKYLKFDEVNGTYAWSLSEIYSGTAGQDSTSGTSGTDGTSGSSGTDGTLGLSGTDGTSGINGTSGSSGTSGIEGGGLFTVTNSGQNYLISGYSGFNPTLTLVKGQNYYFDVSSLPSAHPFALRLPANNIAETFEVSVQNVNGTNVYFINGVEKPSLNLVRGGVYTFDQSAASNANHPLRFRVGGNPSASFTDGVSWEGTPGQAGAKTVFTVPSNAPSTLQYYCTNHPAAMGNTIAITTENTAPVPGTTNNDPVSGKWGTTTLIQYRVPNDAPNSIIYQCFSHPGSMLATINLVDQNGSSGTDGTSGSSGVSGTGGTPGSSGTDGTSGVSGTVYAFKADMGRLGETGTGDQTDISQVNQRTAPPYTSTIAGIGTIPTASNDNKIMFNFPSESFPPSAIHIYAYDANSNFYVWTQIDTSSANQNSINQVAGTTLIPTLSPGGNSFSDTDLVTSFNNLFYSIELSSSRLGAANKSGFGITYGHYFIFFTFPS